ncbi:unnamed protein product [Prunus armeniaca]
MATVPSSSTYSLHLTDAKQAGLVVDLATLEDLRSDHCLCLVGKLATDRPFHKENFQSTMLHLWNFLEVLAMEPWSFNHILLILAPTDGATPVREIPLHTCSLKVHDHMPILGMTATMAKLIGNQFGNFLEVSTEDAATIPLDGWNLPMNDYLRSAIIVGASCMVLGIALTLQHLKV